MGADPEQLIQQALRAQVGGPKRALAGEGGGSDGGDGRGAMPATRIDSSGWMDRFSTAQVLLMAAIVGLIIGMAAGFVVLFTR